VYAGWIKILSFPVSQYFNNKIPQAAIANPSNQGDQFRGNNRGNKARSDLGVIDTALTPMQVYR
jgi:hypothetical protein